MFRFLLTVFVGMVIGASIVSYAQKVAKGGEHNTPVGPDIPQPAEVIEQKYQILRFGSPLCVPCQITNARWHSLGADELAAKHGVKVFYLPVEKFPELVKQWKVTRWPTTILLECDTETGLGKPIRRKEGALKIDEIKTFLNPALTLPDDTRS